MITAVNTSRSGGWAGIEWPHRVMVLAVLLCGFGLVLHDLLAVYMWSDEAWSVHVTSTGSPLDVLTGDIADDVHPPLYFMELWFWRKAAGSSVYVMRYASVLITLLGIALVYRLGLALFSARAGLLAGLFFALHDLVHVVGREVRHYPQQITLTALVMWLYWRLWQRPARGRGAAFALAGAALLWTHYWGGFVLAALALHALLTRRESLRTFVLAFAAAGLLFVPWLPTLAHQLAADTDGISHALPNSRLGYATLTHQLAGKPEAFWLVLGAVGLLGALRCAGKEWRPTPASALPALVLAVTVGGSVALNTHFAVLSLRALALVIPALLVLAAHTLAQFRWPEQGVIAGFVVIHALTTTAAQPPVRPPWPEVADFLAQHSTSSDLILLELNNRDVKKMEEVSMSYFLKHSGGNIRFVSTEGAREADPDGFAATLEQLIADKNGLWVLKLGWPYYDLHAELLARGFVETAPASEWPPFRGWPITVRRFDRPADSGEVVAAFGQALQLVRGAATVHEDWVTVEALWTAPGAPDYDYSVSAFLLDANGQLVSQHDGYPFDNRSPTSGWRAGDLHFDSHMLPTAGLAPGEYDVALKVYHFAGAGFDQVEVVPPSGCGAGVVCETEYVVLDTVTIRR